MKFFELNRTFHTLSTRERDGEAIEIRRLLNIGESYHWSDLIIEYRLVILSEAGSGKTAEIENIAGKLREQQKRAFFLRLEHIERDFESSFEVGTYEEFGEWLRSSEEAWLLLDSVDEARLQAPRDFERAIRKLSGRIKTATDRVHIVITGRTPAWRPKSDLDLCTALLPYSDAITVKDSPQGDTDSKSAIEDQKIKTETRKKDRPLFKIVTLDDLSPEQIEIYAKARGVKESKTFLEAVERADAWSFTSRPQDLKELIDYWEDQGRIGGRLEIMRNSIIKRLAERDQDRADTCPLSAEKARQGAMLLAAAATLAGQQTIRVPDGANNKKGIAVQDILPDWDDREQATLLSRPIFDEEIYGTVRFHHRSVREYLAAEWFSGLLKCETSRRAIEQLFFRNQYGMDIVVPTLRPVLSWLILEDEKVRERVSEIKPEIFFEGGDPSRLPLETRRRILLEVCKHMASGPTEHTVDGYEAVQRFANTDLADDVRQLIRKYADNDELTAFLLRMVWVGRIKALLPEAMEAALNAFTGKYACMAAFRAVKALGSGDDQDRILQNFLEEADELDRNLLSTLVDNLQPTEPKLQWLLVSLEKSEPEEPYTVDHLTDSVTKFAETASSEILSPLIAGLNRLLRMPPVIERQCCEVSERFRWLMVPACKAIERLVLARHSASLEWDVLEVLHKFSVVRGYEISILTDIKADFTELVPAWQKLNRALFWFEIQKSREECEKRNGERMISFQHMSSFDSFWRFQEDDFSYLIKEIQHRKELDDKLVALSLALHLFKEADRPSAWLEHLEKVVGSHGELAEALSTFLNPPPPDENEWRWKKSKARYKRRAETRQRIQSNNTRDWKLCLRKKLEEITAEQCSKPGSITNALYYLFQQARKQKSSSSRWSGSNWKNLIPEYGDDVARFFRESTVSFWRSFNPKLRSEGAPINQTPYGVVIGLAGLEIEANESEFWPANLNLIEVERACRYASHELNGFPTWFPKLFELYPEEVCSFVMQEVRYELSLDDPETDTHYIISDVSYSGQWLWNRLTHDIYSLLKREPGNISNLEHLLKILQGSDIEDISIQKLASRKCRTLKKPAHLARWYAVWTGVDPKTAITSLSGRIEKIADQKERTIFAMTFVTQLLGGRMGGGTYARKLFKRPSYLKSLYLLMIKHIRYEDDLNRIGNGAYTPRLRDHAQEARSSLFNILRNIPGKEAFLMLQELARDHPAEDFRPMILHYAMIKAEEEGDLTSWTPQQVRDFHEKLERTPGNHRELAEFAVSRLFDLKDDLENGDSSVAGILLKVSHETDMRKFIGRELRTKAFGRYSIPQEEELADSKKPDLRFHGSGLDQPVPVELKIADKWSGPKLFERLENQLCGDYLRDVKSGRGVFLLVNRGEERSRWQLPGGGKLVAFSRLVTALQEHWEQILSPKFFNIDDITVVGIDLTARFR